MKEIIIYSKKLANKLLKDGYTLISSEINTEFTQFKVFKFEYDEFIDTLLKDKSKLNKYLER